MDQEPKKELPNLLVVCHGNICRSPLAGVILSTELGNESVRSRGFVNPNRRAAKKIREYAERVGYDLSGHRSRIIGEEDVDWADKILYMDAGNLRRFGEKFGDSLKTVCLASYVHEEKIPDPNYLPRGDRLECILDTIREACENLLREIKNPAG